MARPSLLDEEQELILHTRIKLSRETGGFSLTQIGNGWEMSIATLHRYKSPEYREASREYSRRSYLSYRKALQRGVCYRCQDDLLVHPRCSYCEILLHIGSVFGHTENGTSCTGCEEARYK